MISKIPSIIILLASIILITTGSKLSIPDNYTWPLNTKNLCFAGRFKLTLNVNYVKSDGTQATANIPLDNNTFRSYSASCKAPDNVHVLTIAMLNSFTAIIFNFTVDDKNVTSLSNIYGYITVDDQQTYIKDYANGTAGLHKFSSRSNESLFEAGRGYSYRCNSKTPIKDFDTNSTLGIASIDVENLRIQPFVDDSKQFNEYDDEKVCTDDLNKNSNLIPIIVGACLAALVVIVLIAYLLGRRRSRNGYQSV